MLNQSVASRIARTGARSAYNPSPDIPELTEGQAAARLGDGIKHKSFWAALAGAVVGALIAAAAFTVATMLFGGPFVLFVSVVAIGSMAASYAASKNGHPGVAAAAGKVASTAANVTVLGLGDVIEKASSAVTNFVDDMGSMDGKIATGVKGVIIEGKPAARAGVKLNDPEKPAPHPGLDDNLAEDVALNFSSAQEDTVQCDDHSSKPPRIAEGSDCVFINGQPAARKGDKTECGAQIKQGAATVFVGVGTAQYLNVAEEFSWWQKAILVAVEFLVPPSRGLLKGFGKLFTRLGRRALLKGARIGALKTARAIKNMRVHPSCAAAAFKNNTGFRRYQEAMKRFFKGDPIDVVTGEVFEQRTDIELGQTLPLKLVRTFVHNYEGQGLTGKNQADSFSEVALLSDGGEQVEIRCAEGCSLCFYLPSGYDRTSNPEHPEFTLTRYPEGLALTDRRTSITRWFCPPEGKPDAGEYRLARHEDRHGNTIRFIRDDEQRLLRIIHSDGPVLDMVWGTDGWLDAVLRTDNQLQDTLVSYRRNGRGELTEADSRAFYHLFYDYTPEGRIARWHDNDKTWTRYEYDKQGRCAFSEAADGFYTVRFHYAPGCTSVTDSRGHTSHFRYDSQNRVTETEEPGGHITRFIWSDYGHLLSRTSPAGRMETFEYLRDTGLVTVYTASGGACWRYGWDEHQQMVSVTDPAGQVWHRQYDEQGNPVDFIAPDGSRTQLEYNRHGLLTTVTDSDGARSVFQYDINQRLHSVLDAEGRTLHLRHNRRDRLSSLSMDGGKPWRYEYDSHDRLQISSRPDNSHELLEHDRHGNLVRYTDGNGVVWHLEYGAFDLPVARVDGEGHRWEYGYDRDTLQLTQVTTPAGETFSYTLDACGRVVEERDFAGVTWRYRRDEDGNCTAKQNGLGQKTKYLWDAAGRLMEMTIAEGVTQWQYDIQGRVVCIDSPEGVLCYGYDERGRVVREEKNGRVTEREYPQARTMLRRILPPEGEGTTAQEATFRVNYAGELTGCRLSDTSELALEYNGQGRESRRSCETGFVLVQEYDATGKLVSQRAGCETDSDASMPGGTIRTALWRRYEYDGAQNVVAVNDDHQALRYVMNGNGQVTAVMSHGQARERYGYDECGYLAQQWTGEKVSLLWDNHYTRGHRLTWHGDVLAEYDDAGRMTAQSITRKGHRPAVMRFRWDSQDRLTGLVNWRGEQWEYRYDALGRRTEKSCEQKGIRITWLWDGDTPAEEREYRHGELWRVRQSVYNGFELLAQHEQWREGEAGETWRRETRYAVSSPAGEPVALFSGNGECVWRKPERSLWGVKLWETGENPRDPGLLFAGQMVDSESGLAYNRFRYYSAETACYLTSDPIGLAGGLNLYYMREVHLLILYSLNY
ncbi:PAAR/RHS domain-containing protein [Escherichia albertii]